MPPLTGLSVQRPRCICSGPRWTTHLQRPLPVPQPHGSGEQLAPRGLLRTRTPSTKEPKPRTVPTRLWEPCGAAGAALAAPSTAASRQRPRQERQGPPAYRPGAACSRTQVRVGGGRGVFLSHRGHISFTAVSLPSASQTLTRVRLRMACVPKDALCRETPPWSKI